MAMKVDGEYAFKWMSLGKFCRQAEKIGMRASLMERILNHQAKQLLKKAPALVGRCHRQYPSSIYVQIAESIMARCKQLGLQK